MSRLPSLRPAEVVRALERAGFARDRQSGSHLVLAHPDGRFVTVPIHRREMKRGTLASIVKDAGFTQEEFSKLL